MKKWIPLVLALLLTVCLFAACGDDETPQPAGDDGAASVQQGEPDDAADGQDELEYYDQDFELINSTEYTIEGLYIMPTGEEDFSNNIVEGQDFSPETTCTITFPIVASADYFWDIYVVLDDGRTVLLGDPKPLSSITALEFVQEGDELGVYTTNA